MRNSINNIDTEVVAIGAMPCHWGDLASTKEADLPEVRSNEAAIQHQVGHVVTGVVAGLDRADKPLVDFSDNSSAGPIVARTIVPISRRDIHREVVIMFEQGDLMRPIVLGLLHASSGSNTQVIFEIDGEELVCTGSRQVVLRCGSASITLTRAGKIIIEGEYVLTRAKGLNRIKGGSVQIN